ncbi:anti-sigma factor domain-containing protein [Lacinutrix sp. 5H-3-7-4]|uniref:anti-sigma factor domain-containing protein n=1 Tax=Lacinutrix sp. (strain 5H-3-7-4) TaxID=983544 RepID=UPI00020A367A|nr:anti-sigma factor [Lacinutrix sp. 5H-3-7-4]AEH01286.1 RNA polymerase sigma-70 factor [Lacinutrix sp. 5H-3-7-4]
MTVDTKTFLKSGLLEKYLIGQTTTQETLEVETHIESSIEVKTAYNKLQDNLELVALANAKEAPVHILGDILNELDEKPVVTMAEKPKKSFFAFGIAASVAALIFAGTSLFFYNMNVGLMEENQKIVDEVFDLRDDILGNNLKLEALSSQIAQLNDPETEKYILKGDRRAKNLKTVAYINPKKKKAMIDVVSLPILPANKEYQMWVEIQDKMVNMGALTVTERRLQEVPFTKDALGLSITIEEKGKNVLKSSETPVAEISLKLDE